MRRPELSHPALHTGSYGRVAAADHVARRPVEEPCARRRAGACTHAG